MPQRVITPFFSEKTVHLRPGQVAAIRRPGAEAPDWLVANVEGQSLVMIPAVTIDVTESPELYNAISQGVRSSSGQLQYSEQGEQQGRSRAAGAGAGGGASLNL